MPGFWISFLCLFFLTASSQLQNQNSRLTERTIHLKNHLGVVKIQIPTDYDTFYTRHINSDNDCGDMESYGYQSSLFPILPEIVGEFINGPDSTYSFAISHKTYTRCDSGTTFDPTKYLEIMTKKMKDINGNPIDMMLAETTKINGIDFVVFGFRDTFPGNRIQTYLTATTQFNSAFITLSFTRFTKQKYPGDFIKDSYEMLKTVRLSPK
jgi:hypothetical protein